MMARPGGWGLYERSHQQSLMAMLRLSAWGRGVMDKAGWSEEAGGQGQGWGGGGQPDECLQWRLQSQLVSQQWRRWEPEGRPGQGGAGGAAGAAAAPTAGPCKYTFTPRGCMDAWWLPANGIPLQLTAFLLFFCYDRNKNNI